MFAQKGLLVFAQKGSFTNGVDANTDAAWQCRPCPSGRQVFCNRDCILKTFTERGTDYIGQMALQNCRDLEPILWWNYEHGVRLFRCGSANPVCSARSFAPAVHACSSRRIEPLASATFATFGYQVEGRGSAQRMEA